MATNTLNILKPSVNNLTARIFVRAAGLDFEELDVWGQTTTPEFLQKDPAHLTPMLEEEGLPRGSLWESCAIMQYLCNKHGLDGFYPAGPGRAGDGRQRDVLSRRHPLSADHARDLSGPFLPAVSGRGGFLRRGRRREGGGPGGGRAAIAEPLDVYRAFFLADRPFIGGDRPSIADIRLAASIEFLAAIDYDLPAWAREYMTRMEESLGEAYTEPAADVRGYIEYAKSQSA